MYLVQFVTHMIKILLMEFPQHGIALMHYSTWHKVQFLIRESNHGGLRSSTFKIILHFTKTVNLVDFKILDFLSYLENVVKLGN